MRRLSESIRQLSESIKRLSESIKRSSESIKRLWESMRRLSESIRRLSESIRRLLHENFLSAEMKCFLISALNYRIDFHLDLEDRIEIHFGSFPEFWGIPLVHIDRREILV